jgi:hypothetical protein
VVVKKDKRYKPAGEHEAVETEALKQEVIVGIVRDQLDELLPLPIEDIRWRESVERVEVRERLTELEA